MGKGSVAEAKAATGKVCSQLVLLNGTLDMSSKLTGPRVADVKNVAFNRTLGAGLSVTKVRAGWRGRVTCAHGVVWCGGVWRGVACDKTLYHTNQEEEQGNQTGRDVGGGGLLSLLQQKTHPCARRCCRCCCC